MRKKKKSFSGKQTKPSKVTKNTVRIEGMRLNKFVAHSGLCSRRKAAELIKKGEVLVNGKAELEPGYEVKASDKITYKGKLLSPEERLVYLLMNKPKNTITTLSDDRGRKTVMDLIGDKVKERIFPVGRLDRNTTGLLLLTNDGELAKKLTHPKHEMQKVYHVTLDKPVTKRDLEQISAGLTLEDGPAPVDAVNYLVDRPKKEVGIEIHIGRNRIVRRIFEHLGYTVVKLDRVFFAGLNKKDLPRGRFRHLTDREIVMLKHFSQKN